MQTHFNMMAKYNQWANRRLYEAAARLPDGDYRADRGAFFRSVHGTLNHLLVTDRIWRARCEGATAPAYRLDAILCNHFDELRAAREAEDRHIVDYIERLDAAAFDGSIRYARVSTPEVFEQRLALALAHWFNHQTHHRGQAHALLTGLGHEGPEMDLLYFQRLHPG